MKTQTHGFVEARGAVFHFEHMPADHSVRAPTLVLLHEFGGTLRSWDGLRTALAPGRPVLAFDARGAGQSEKVRGALSLHDLVDDLDALLDVLRINGPMVLCGCALGSACALAFAARHPERVAAVVALAPALGVSPEVSARMLARADEIERGGMRRAVDATMAAAYPERLREPPERFTAYRLRWLGNDPGSYAAGLRLLATMNPLPLLTQIDCPVLVTAGLQDANRSPDQIRQKTAALRGATHVTIDSGHFMAVQSPGLLATLIERFLTEHGFGAPAATG